MNPTPEGTSLAGVIPPGAVRSRRDRPIRHGRWYLATPDGIAPIGWGDLSMGDLDQIAQHLGPAEMFLAIHEYANNPDGAGISRWYDHQDRPTIAALVAHATFVVTAGAVRIVDLYRRANRQGAMWVSPGYRHTRTDRIINTAKQRVLAISPERLADELTTLTTPASGAEGE